MWLVMAIISFIFLLVIILITRLTIIFDLYHGNDNDHIKLEFRIWFGIIKYKKEIPLIKVDDNSPTLVYKEKTKTGKNENTTQDDVYQFTSSELQNSMYDTEKILKHVVKLHRIVRNFLRKVSVKQLEWQTAIGVGDAAFTGMATGGIWAIKGSIIGIISHYMKLKEGPKVNVVPFFKHTISQTRFKCIFQFRIGQAMLAGVKMIKYWKGGRPQFKSKRLSSLSRQQ